MHDQKAKFQSSRRFCYYNNWSTFAFSSVLQAWLGTDDKEPSVLATSSGHFGEQERFMAEVPLTWEVPATTRVMSVACHIWTLNPCVVSSHSGNSICWTEAVPLRGMFTAILKMTKLVWRQKKTKGPLFVHLCRVRLPPAVVTWKVGGKVSAREHDTNSTVCWLTFSQAPSYSHLVPGSRI